MNLRLNKLDIENLKGIHKFVLDAGGKNATITAENGIGKTSVYDAFLWPLFDKDSAGRTAFEVWPLDSENKPLRGLETKVTLELQIDGQTRMFRKELHEKVVKDVVKGYETYCWVDDVPQKVGDFKKIVSAIVAEDVFRALTDLTYVCQKLSRQERRALLLDIAGQIGTPKGFGKLLSALKGRSLEDYKKILQEQKSRYEKEKADVEPRIKEVQRSLAGYLQQDTTALKSKRTAVEKAMAEIDKARAALLAAEKGRQKRIEALNRLTVAQLHRASQLKGDMQVTLDLLNEKASLRNEVNTLTDDLASLKSQEGKMILNIHTLATKITAKRQDLSLLRDECTALGSATLDETICFNCSQPYPAATREKRELDRKKRHDEKAVKAKALKLEIDALDAEHEAWKGKLSDLQTKCRAKAAEVKDKEDRAVARLKEIDVSLANPPEPDYKQDEEWVKLGMQIAGLQAEIGDPVAEQLTDMEIRRAGAQGELNKLNAALAQADRAEQDKVRIAELSDMEKALAQKISDCEAELNSISEYNVAQAQLIETAVNGRFHYVTWKLFDYFQNGEIDDRVCEAVYQGVPYSDLSTGQQIRVGIDIVNVLSQHYGVSVPLFVDHAESLTLPIETDTQVIQLRAEVGVGDLQVKVG